MKNFIFTIFFVIICLVMTAQPTIQWQKCLGGIYGEYFATSIYQTNDGGYVLVGNDSADNGDVTGTHGLNDIWVVKLDVLGSIQWQKSLGGSNNDDGYAIQQTLDGGYIVAGASNSNDGDVAGNQGNYDYWIIKLDNSGSIQWQKSLGGTNDDQAYSIKQISGGGYIISGFSKSNNGDVSGNQGNKDYWIVKIDSIGSIIWQKSLGGTNLDEGYSILQTPDSGFIVVGSSNSNNGDVSGNHGLSDYWVVKLDSVGIIQWQYSYGGSFSDIGYNISPTSDGGFLISGSSESSNFNVIGNNGLQDYWVIKINSSGIIQWGKNFGGSSNDTWYRCIAQELSDGNYIIGGTTSSNNIDVAGNNGVTDFWIVKTDNTGNIIWQKCYGGSSNDIFFSMQLTTDSGVILSGGTTSNDGDVSGNHGYFDLWVVKLNSILSGIENIYEDDYLVIYPNPTSKNFNIEYFIDDKSEGLLKITDVAGKLLYKKQLSGGKQKVAIEDCDLSNGMYLCSFYIDGELQKQEKLVIIK